MFKQQNEDNMRWFQASMSGSIVEIQDAIDKGTMNLNFQDLYGRSAMWLASHNGHLRVVEVLVEEPRLNQSINAADCNGDSPIHAAASTDHLAIVCCLKDHGGNIGAVNNNGNSVLHTAAAAGYVNVVRYLIEQNVNINLVNNEGKTPLHVCGEEETDGTIETFTLLVENKATITQAAKNAFREPNHASTNDSDMENSATDGSMSEDDQPNGPDDDLQTDANRPSPTSFDGSDHDDSEDSAGEEMDTEPSSTCASEPGKDSQAAVSSTRGKVHIEVVDGMGCVGFVAKAVGSGVTCQTVGHCYVMINGIVP